VTGHTAVWLRQECGVDVGMRMRYVLRVHHILSLSIACAYCANCVWSCGQETVQPLRDSVIRLGYPPPSPVPCSPERQVQIAQSRKQYVEIQTFQPQTAFVLSTDNAAACCSLQSRGRLVMRMRYREQPAASMRYYRPRRMLLLIAGVPRPLLDTVYRQVVYALP
jgi:hypothetical protein